MSLLKVSGLRGGYGASQILFGIDFEIGAGEAITLLGRNGMGKTTTIKALMGLLPQRSGAVTLAGERVERHRPFRVARLGIGLVPEGRQVFPTLTVEENLIATARRSTGRSDFTLETVYALFPRLHERQTAFASTLSGGEQQMLAVGRALMTNPRLLILDEATEGLAPIVRETIWDGLAALRRQGLAMIIIDKNIQPLLKLADRHYVIEKGEIVWTGTSEELEATPDILDRYLGIQ
jgi:branched-chain amino acid transport system ATP-binding protein